MGSTSSDCLASLTVPFLIRTKFVARRRTRAGCRFVGNVMSILGRGLRCMGRVARRTGVFFKSAIRLRARRYERFLGLRRVPALVSTLRTGMRTTRMMSRTFMGTVFGRVRGRRKVGNGGLFVKSEVVLANRVRKPSLPGAVRILKGRAYLGEVGCMGGGIL